MEKFILLTLMVCSASAHISSSSEHPQTLEHTEDSTATSDQPVSDHRFFLHEIFSKYGQNGQMTFEGFEHLLESLGLGNILIEDHDVMAHQEVDFIHVTHDHAKKSEHNGTTETHDHSSAQDHKHTIQENGTSVYHYKLGETQFPELLVNISTLVDQHQELDDAPEIVIEQCLSPKEILAAFGINQTTSLNPVAFLHLCPAIIYELDQGHCIFSDKSESARKSIASLDQWLYSSCAVLAISLCGLFSVAIIPIMQKWFYKTLLQFLVGLAIGSLSGDALLHLMPHAMLGGNSSHDHGDSLQKDFAERDAVWKGFAALGGIFFFFIAERALGNYANYRRQKKLKTDVKIKEVPSGHVGEKLSGYRKNSYTFDVSEKDIMDNLNGLSSRKSSVGSLSALDLELTEVVHTKVISPASHGHSHHSHEVPESVSAVAWMVIMGDGLHNFCDGLAIGTAFATGLEGGLSTAVAVFCHELPHELGDFAMLLKTGMKVRQALMYNILSSILCLVGMVIGVSLGNVETATGWVFAATAGMFLYIALVDMLPELSDGGEENSSSYQLAVQILGISCGISIMLLIANYEHELKRIVS